MPNIEPVEIKVTVANGQSDTTAVPGAIAALGLAMPDSSREIWFLEDCTPGLRTALPLLGAGVIIRLRQEAGGGGEATVKLRPCRRSQLADGWTAKAKDEGWKYRIEEDWAGTSQTLAASCLSDLPAGALAAALGAAAGWEDLFHAKQKQFLAECADLRVTLDGLVALGPIAATKWDHLSIDEHEVVAERWIVDGLDFLELSIRNEGGPSRAAAAQKRFTAALRDRGLAVPVAQTKTKMVLEHLAQAQARRSIPTV